MSAYETRTITNAGKSQLDIYLEEPKLEYKHFQDLNVLEYWKDQSHRFPELALMACDILAIPITTVASESAFSIGGLVLTKYRSSMIPENFQALICTRNWLHGFESNVGKEQVDKSYEKTRSTGSNSLEIIDDESEQEGCAYDYDHGDVMEDDP